MSEIMLKKLSSSNCLNKVCLDTYTLISTGIFNVGLHLPTFWASNFSNIGPIFSNFKSLSSEKDAENDYNIIRLFLSG